MAQQGVTVGNEMKLSKGKLRPNNRSKFLENEISRSQTTFRPETQSGTAEMQGGHSSVPQCRAHPSQHSIRSPTLTAGSSPIKSAGPRHQPRAGWAQHCVQHPSIRCGTGTPLLCWRLPWVSVPACKPESRRAWHFFFKKTLHHSALQLTVVLRKGWGGLGKINGLSEWKVTQKEMQKCQQTHYRTSPFFDSTSRTIRLWGANHILQSRPPSSPIAMERVFRPDGSSPQDLITNSIFEITNQKL